MRRIFLIGYMGSGKTTLGKAFAKAAGLEFIVWTGILKSVCIRPYPKFLRNKEKAVLGK